MLDGDYAKVGIAGLQNNKQRQHDGQANQAG